MNIFKVLKKVLFFLPMLGALVLLTDATGNVCHCDSGKPDCQSPNYITEFPCISDICVVHIGSTCRICVESPPE